MDPLNAAQIQAEKNVDSVIDYSNAQLPTALHNEVTAFLKELKRPKYSKPMEYSDLIHLFRQFYEDFTIKSRECILGTVNLRRFELEDLGKGTNKTKPSDHENDTDDLTRKYVEVAEFKVTHSLHDRLLYKNDTDCQINDFIKLKASLILKIVNLDWYELLDLQPDAIDLQLPIFTAISEQFNILQAARTPIQKLNCLTDIHARLIDCLPGTDNGDHVLPMVIYLILINENTQLDLWLSLTYVKNFHNASHFRSEELYCLTNLEAALTFIQTVELNGYAFANISREQEAVLHGKSTADDHRLVVPATPEKLGQQQQQMPLGFVSSALDTGFKNVFGRFKPESSPLATNPEPAATGTTTTFNSAQIGSDYNPVNPIRNFMGDVVMKWTSKSPVSMSASNAVHLSSGEGSTGNRMRSGSGSSFLQRLKSAGGVSRVDLIVEDGEIESVNLKRFQGRRFDDLSVSELREMFADYRVMASHLQGSSSQAGHIGS